MSDKIKGPSTIYNDLWVLMNKLTTTQFRQIPEKFMDFVKDNMVRDYTSGIKLFGPVDWNLVSDETRNMLLMLFLTYLAMNPEERRNTADILFKNEYGKDAEMNEEDYQDFIKTFDEWNTVFGLVPFWGESRGWCPESCYEVTGKDEEADIQEYDFGLKWVLLTDEQRASVVKEAKDWVMIREEEYEETLYWHDNDHSEWTSTKEVEDFYRKRVIVKDGHFAGIVLNTELTSGTGLSSYRSDSTGIVLTDGTSKGRTYDHYSRSSDETSYSETISYSLQKKQKSDH